MDLLDTRRPRLFLTLFCLLLWLPGFFTLPPTDRDESRFAQASKQMLETGDYVRIMNGTEPRNRKPIGIYWLQVPLAAAAHAVGVATQNPIWPYRLPSLLGGLGSVLAVFGFGQALVGRRAALLAAGMLAASMVLVVETHLAKTDAALLCSTTVAMGFLSRAYIAPGSMSRMGAGLFWLAIGAGVLLKGPIAPMVVAVATASLVVLDRKAGWLRALRPGWGVALMFAVVAPWFIAIGMATHGAFFHDAIAGDLANKLSHGDDAHGAPPGLHLLLMPLLVFPSTLLVLLGLPAAWMARREPAVRFLLAWLVPCWVIFEVVPTKLPHYTLPLYPALCLLGAWACVTEGRAVCAWWRRTAQTVTVLAALCVVVGSLAVAWIAGEPWMAAPTIVAAATLGWIACSPRGAITALAAMPVLTAALLGWQVPRAEALWLAPRAEQAMQAAGLEGSRLGSVGFHEPSLVFLAGTQTDLLPTGEAGAQALATGEVGALLVAERDEAAFAAAAAQRGLVSVRVGLIEGFNYSRGRFTALGLYRRQ